MPLIQDHVPARKAEFPSHEQALRAALAGFAPVMIAARCHPVSPPSSK
jgi:hypothetical protein